MVYRPMFRIDYPFKQEILACGAQQQAGFCLTKKNCAYVVNDLGNLDNPAACEHYRREIERFKKELKIKPKVISYDLHPEYNSTKYAQGLNQGKKGLKCLPIQHHKAHLASCMAENGLRQKIIGIVFDGDGLGEDGKLWGGDFFVGSLHDLKRVAHLNYATTDSSSSSSMARLFDSVFSLLGLRDRLDYPGQGVTELARIINRSTHVAGKAYDFSLKANKDQLLILTESIIQGITEDLKKNISKSIISTAFHNTIIEMARGVCRKIEQKQKLKQVILTGEVFYQNKVLFNRLKDVLLSDGFEIITHRHFSSNDSNISFGQAVLADRR